MTSHRGHRRTAAIRRGRPRGSPPNDTGPAEIATGRAEVTRNRDSGNPKTGDRKVEAPAGVAVAVEVAAGAGVLIPGDLDARVCSKQLIREVCNRSTAAARGKLTAKFANLAAVTILWPPARHIVTVSRGLFGLCLSSLS